MSDDKSNSSISKFIDPEANSFLPQLASCSSHTDIITSRVFHSYEISPTIDQQTNRAILNADHLHHLDIHGIAGMLRICEAYYLVEIDSISCVLVPGPGSVGRIAKFTCGFDHTTATAPTTFGHIASLPGAYTHTYAGVADPFMGAHNFKLVFDYGIRHLSQPAPSLGGRPRFYAALNLQNLGNNQHEGPVFTINFDIVTRHAGPRWVYH